MSIGQNTVFFISTAFYRLNMSATQTDVFTLNLDPLCGEPLSADLEQLSAIDSQTTFNEICRAVCQLWKQRFPDGSGSVFPEFQRLSAQIAAGAIDNQVIPTSWGGVVVTRHQHPEVEKYLVIRQGGYLALEKHAEKDEHMEVKEGAGILLWRDTRDSPLAVHELHAGDKFHFKPGMEHCIIGTEDLLIFERSTDPLGMDQDLIFIYTPEG